MRKLLTSLVLGTLVGCTDSIDKPDRAQPEFDDPRYSGINPYALGFAMMEDIARIAETPTEEDRVWFPDIAGQGDAMGLLRHAWANYRDESFIAQYLSPHLIRKLRLFRLHDDANDADLRVTAIHDERGYKNIRHALARQYDIAWQLPDIQVVDVDLAGDRKLILQHRALNRILLIEADAKQVLQHLADLWSYDVLLHEVDPADDKVLKEHSASPRKGRINAPG